MIKCLPQGQDLLSAHPDSSNCALITLTKVCNIVLRCRRLCRVFGMCDNSDQRMRGEGGLLLLCVQRHARKAVLPALPDIVACMSSRCDATHRNVFGHSLSADVYWMCLRQLRLRILHTVSDRPSLRVTFFKSHKADPAVLGVIVSSGNRMQLLKNYWDGRQSRGACPCPQNEGWCRDYNLFSRYFNYSIPLEDLIAALVKAIQAWHDIRRV